MSAAIHRRKRTSVNTLMVAYLVHHLRVMVNSLGHLWRNRVSTLMTSLVIAISLALPTSLYVALDNISEISSNWDDSTQISLYLNKGVHKKALTMLVKKLKLHKEIKRVSVIDRGAALDEFRKLSGFGDALLLLKTNPLPTVILLHPKIDTSRPGQIAKLVEKLSKLPQVELAQLDVQWVKRLYSMIELARRAVWIIGSLLAVGVLLIIGNTIRLDIQNRREEIEVTKLIGASNAFIRRPFLYSGLWYGFSGGVLAWLLTALSISLLDAPVQRLASLYQSAYHLHGLGPADSLGLIAISLLLGLAGSWLAVTRHLHTIEPS